MKYQKYIGLGLIVGQMTGIGCGSSSSSGTLTGVSLATLPSASSMVSASTSNAVVYSGASASMLDRDSSSGYAVTGTAPLLVKIGLAGGVTADTAFWNGLVAQ